MISRRRTSRIFGTLGAAAVASALTLLPAQAAAQEESNAVSATGKGIAGGAMLGAEVVMITTAIIGATDWWPYVLFGAVGAGGGAVGGYFVEDAIGDGAAEPALYMLAGGMALVVPTLVAVLNATAYDPTDDEEEGDESSTDDEPDGTPGVDGNLEVETSARRGLPPALIGLSTTQRGTRVRLGVPAAHVGPRFSPREMATFGVEQGTEVSFPIVRGTF
ncbi:MAG: hypothetical protein JRI68_23680 [Deltaproteobacteria bacterium]|nr:hypothetical protein [Deltaproteobacteria bacterium]